MAWATLNQRWFAVETLLIIITKRATGMKPTAGGKRQRIGNLPLNRLQPHLALDVTQSRNCIK